MSNPNPGCAADRSLLFGLLALQMGFVTRDSLLQALQTWAADKSRSVRDVFVQQRSMPPGPATLIDDLVHAQFAQHQHRPPKWLRDLSVLVIVRKDLAGIDDPEIRATLAAVPVEQGSDASADAPADDPYATAPSPIPTAPAHGSGVATDGGRRFRILRPHARGGLGEVYLARDDELGREVALKEIQARHADSPENRTRFVREAEITGGLEHPGIVPVYGLGRHEDGRPFYAMRFIRGNSLKDAVDGLEKDEGARRDAGLREVALRKLVRRIYDVCNALEYAHSRGVVHRDLKPGNIMLGNYGETLVVDWGLAKAGAASPTSTAASEAPLQPASAYDDAATRTGDAIGTPAYMAPEQAAGRLDLLGPRSDVYGLGATLYCVLTGRPPFIDREIHLLLDKVQRGDFARSRRYSPHPQRRPVLAAPAVPVDR
jgi:tRNA A-37 threonylcarbamoyl transferase component Bud32